MGVERNPYLAPEAKMIARSASKPRPFLRFLAGAICLGAGAPFLLFVAAVGFLLVADILNNGWAETVSNFYQRMRVVGIGLSALCGVPLIFAGRAILVPPPGRGAWPIAIPLTISSLALATLVIVSTMPWTNPT